MLHALFETVVFQPQRDVARGFPSGHHHFVKVLVKIQPLDRRPCQGQIRGVGHVGLGLGTLDGEAGVVAPFHDHRVHDHRLAIHRHGHVVVGQPRRHGERLAIGVLEHGRQPQGVFVGHQVHQPARGKRHGVGFQHNFGGFARGHVELKIPAHHAQQDAISVLLHANADGVLARHGGGAGEFACVGVDAQRRICRHGVVPGETGHIRDVDVRRCGGRIGLRVVGVASLLGRTERVHQVVPVRVHGAVVPHKGEVAAQGHGRQFLKGGAAVVAIQDVGSRDVHFQTHAGVFAASEIVKVHNRGVATTPLVDQIPAVGIRRQFHRGGVDRLLDAQLRGRGAARVAHFHRHSRDVGLGERHGDDVFRANGPCAVPHAHGGEGVEAGAVGVGGAAVAVHRQHDAVFVAPQMHVVEVSAHQMRSPSPWGHHHAEPSQRQRATPSEGVAVV